MSLLRLASSRCSITFIDCDARQVAVWLWHTIRLTPSSISAGSYPVQTETHLQSTWSAVTCVDSGHFVQILGSQTLIPKIEINKRFPRVDRLPHRSSYSSGTTTRPCTFLPSPRQR